ncbi:MAG: hypothetical protein JSU77_12965 [Fidelibacterota bacterium]|nr:MAG: hypothetical protein JSU77_12965 [Candidatus Neomarinimicrobiota bacterium]
MLKVLHNRRHFVFIMTAGIFLLTALLYPQQSAHTEYYRSEMKFRQGIKLFPFEIHEADYLKVVHDDQGFVRFMSWHTKEDSLIKIRLYEYWEDDNSVKRLLELTPDSLIIREVLFGDEPRSREFIEYAYGVEFVPDFRNRFTEVRVDSAFRVVSYKFMSAQGQLIGAAFLDYDSLGFLTNETWFQGEKMRRVREFRYIFHRDTGEQEVIERGREGQVVSHVRIKTDPHKKTGWGLGVDVEELLDTTTVKPETVPPDSDNVKVK